MKMSGLFNTYNDSLHNTSKTCMLPMTDLDDRARGSDD